MSTDRLRIFFATMSAGQPTKESTTKCSPFDAEMALREVPRSMPTWRMSAISSPFFRIFRDALEQGAGNLLPVFRALEHRDFVRVRHAADFREDRRHLRRDEYDEGRALDAPVFESAVVRLQVRKELLLDGGGQALRFVAAGVGVDSVERSEEHTSELQSHSFIS